MVFAPARLLLPVRAVEPPHSSALSSASICSASGAYPHFSSFFLYPPSHRNTFSVSASVLGTQSNCAYKKSRHNQLHGPQDKAVSFDDSHNPHTELGFGHSRDLNGRASSAPRFGRVDGNGGRVAWEPNNYPRRKKHGVFEGDVKARYSKLSSSQGSQNASSWNSHLEDEAGNAHYSQTMVDRKSRKFGLKGREMRTNDYSRQSNSYSGSGSASRQRDGGFFQHGASRLDTSRQGNIPDIFSPSGSPGFQEKRGKFNNSWGSSANPPEEFEEQLGRCGTHLCSRSYPPNGAMNFQPQAQTSYSKWSNVSEGRWQEGEVHREEVEKFREENEEPEQENSSVLGSSPISKIMERLRNVDDRVPQLHARGGVQSRSEVADVLDLPSPREYLSDRSLPNLSAEQSEKGLVDTRFSEKGLIDTRFPWERKDVVDEEDSTLARARKLRPLSSGELGISGPELKRLRILALHLKQRVKIGKHGVTHDLVNSIRQRFCTCEVVKVKCEGPPAGIMKQTLETLEEKTGGLIIWKAGSAAVLYRGEGYGQPVSEIVEDLLAKKYQSFLPSDGSQVASSRASEKYANNEVVFLKHGDLEGVDSIDATAEPFDSASGSLDDASENLVSDATLDNASQQSASRKKTRTSGPEFDKLEEYTMEVEEILKDLGPLYEEWTGPRPLPVDADLLPSSIPNYSPPYRLLPFGRRPNINNTTATHVRKLSKSLAPHFVIGRDRDLQGLAAAMVKLWEKSEIAKIGVKRGIMNTSHERIAEDLKQLTGGFYLCRDKYSMTFHRGNDFLPQHISAALANRQMKAEDLQTEEESGRADGSVNIIRSARNCESLPSWVHIMDPEEQIRLKREAARARRVQVIDHLERKLKMALQKKEKAGKELDKVEQLLKPVASSDDKEILTDEERFMLRKLGLKMKAFLLLGRRGVFSGVVQNMHLHWKHRDLVKIVVKERDPIQLNETARMLEAESGGTLISVDPTSKGFAIVVYRGKNYTRPPELRPPNLLTKRLALRRSLEMQRRESLSRHMQGVEQEIAHLRSGLNQMKMLESRDETVLSNESKNAHDVPKHDGFQESQQNQVESVSPTGLQGVTEDLKEISRMQGPAEDDAVPSVPKLSRRKLTSMCEIGPIFKAVRLSKTERHVFRNEVLKMGKALHFLVGRGNPMSTIAKGIRLHFLHHAFVKIGVSYRPQGTSVQDVVEELEDLTGGTAFAQDDFRVILYRGWPSGEDMPVSGLLDVLSTEQCHILDGEEDEEGEDDEEENMVENTLTQAAVEVCEDEASEEAGIDEEGDDDEEEILMQSILSLAAEKNCEDEASEEDEDVEDEGMLQLESSPDEDYDEDVDDEEGDDELRSEVTLVRNLETADDIVDEGLYWDKGPCRKW